MSYEYILHFNPKHVMSSAGFSSYKWAQVKVAGRVLSQHTQNYIEWIRVPKVCTCICRKAQPIYTYLMLRAPIYAAWELINHPQYAIWPCPCEQKTCDKTELHRLCRRWRLYWALYECLWVLWVHFGVFLAVYVATCAVFYLYIDGKWYFDGFFFRDSRLCYSSL